MDDRVTYFEQLQEETGPVVLINKFNVAPEDAEHLLEVWADDAAYMKAQPGLHLNSASPGNGREHDLYQRRGLGVCEGARGSV